MLAMALLALASVASANNAWGNYHWARTANPFTLKLGDNVSATWDPYLAEASSDWSLSSVLETTIVPGGTTARQCKPTTGRIEVCAEKYGFNGWLGLAQIWPSGSHITQAVAKLNDSYFNTSTYNTPARRRLVMCQEIAHDFGLDHQDVIFNNPNLGSCMDYTSDPDGPLSNEHPNQHDYEQLGIIYSHTDGTTRAAQASPPRFGSHEDEAPNDPSQFGAPAGKKDGKGRDILFAKDLGGGRKLFTWVIWADEHGNPNKP
jgi:hypothetical protein